MCIHYSFYKLYKPIIIIVHFDTDAEGDYLTRVTFFPREKRGYKHTLKYSLYSTRKENYGHFKNQMSLAES